ncbi:MAG TPA: twin-arginine translocase TatA/TatE family subunit [Vicinamibacterales bacterium]|nr:twin-arginine translocase TatA/TatE family subunit [Vicinamibacterales bacterium]
MGLGVMELLVILAILLLLFGARRLPELGRGLGKAVHSVRQATKDRDA